ncbi:MAG TPA: sigma-54 dependent transcriptional regulator [Terriglobales bacterium]|jgi:DNA-binding NtrC family response regulator
MSPVATELLPPAAASALEGRILIVDDEEAVRESLQTLFLMENFGVEVAADGAQGWDRFHAACYDLVLVDVALPRGSGLDLLHRLREISSVPVIMISAFATVEMAVQAMQGGARTFLQKPWNNEKLLADVRAAIAAARVQQENEQLKRAFKQRYNFENIIGKSEAMLRVFDWVTQVAPSRSTVLLQGESGTGKELIAKALHAHSSRGEFPFVPVNSGSMTTDLLESTLFGHVRGAFTGAIAPKKGLFEAADRGTIFLDEISNMSLETQAKILRVLQDRRFMRLGSNEELQVDVRVIAATNVDLQALVAEGKFRDDLFYRLNVLTLTLPPLRDRREDIPALSEYFLVKYSDENHCEPVRHLTPEALRCLMEYAWPGHVRELENAIERAVVLSHGPMIGPELLPEGVRGGGFGQDWPSTADRASRSLPAAVDEFERRLIVDMLEQTHGRQTEAAERFQIPVSTLNQKIKRFGIDVKKIAR